MSAPNPYQGLSLEQLTELLERVQLHLRRAEREQSQPRARPQARRPLYRHPLDRQITWDGEGQPPSWFEIALEQGRRPEDLRLD